MPLLLYSLHQHNDWGNPHTTKWPYTHLEYSAGVDLHRIRWMRCPSLQGQVVSIEWMMFPFLLRAGPLPDRICGSRQAVSYKQNLSWAQKNILRNFSVFPAWSV